MLGRHGESPARPHLGDGRSHWAPQGKRQSQVLSRVRGRNADYQFLEIFVWFWCSRTHLSLTHHFFYRSGSISMACDVDVAKLRFDLSSKRHKITHILLCRCRLVIIYTNVRVKLKSQAQSEFAYRQIVIKTSFSSRGEEREKIEITKQRKRAAFAERYRKWVFPAKKREAWLVFFNLQHI